MNTFVISGTDTGIGKTVCAAMLTLALRGIYWKPLQCGIEDGSDRETVQKITGLPPAHFLSEKYILKTPLSPERAAEIENVFIDIKSLETVPQTSAPLFIEGAGGLMVPINAQTLFIDLFEKWGLPVILCARTALGTMNHTLLSIEALQKRGIPLHGLVFIGASEPDTMRIIAAHSGAKILGCIPPLETLNAETLQKTFAAHFNKSDFV